MLWLMYLSPDMLPFFLYLFLGGGGGGRFSLHIKATLIRLELATVFFGSCWLELPNHLSIIIFSCVLESNWMVFLEYKDILKA